MTADTRQHLRALTEQERAELPRPLTPRVWRWNPAWLIDERRTQRERRERKNQSRKRR